jgi:hypothetical protein
MNYRKLLKAVVTSSLHAIICEKGDPFETGLNESETERAVDLLVQAESTLFRVLAKWDEKLVRALIQPADQDDSPEIRRDSELSISNMMMNGNSLAADAIVTCNCTHTAKAAATIVEALVLQAISSYTIGYITKIAFNLPEEEPSPPAEESDQAETQ